MCNPNCKHDGGFHLIYNSIEELYKWKCAYSCGLSFPFSPEEAGKHRGEYSLDTEQDVISPEWKIRTIAYVRKANTKPFLKLTEGGKF